LSTSFPQRIFYAQHFLKDPSLVASLLERSSIGANDVVYEIGAGRGIITEQLALRVRRVIAIEKDPRLGAVLRQHFAGQPQVTIQVGDFLRDRLPRQPYKVFANIPFNITSAILSTLTAAEHPPEDAYLVMQREAAAMFLGTPHESLRSILLKPWFEMEIVHHFRRRDFCPAPRVDVVMLRLRKRGPPLVSSADRQGFRDLIVSSFTNWQPRQGSPLKRLLTRHQRNTLKTALAIDLNNRPTAISFEQWLGLFEYLKTEGDARIMQRIAGSDRVLLRQQQSLQKRHRTCIRR
jgi:23S rRNA (adenine-N6)-dimethyltransferase